MSNLSSIGKEGFSPQEEMLELKHKQSSLFIGLPKEKSFQENRISIVPDAVNLLVSHGHDVLVESGAGDNASFTDNQYSEAGAKIVYDVKEVYQADIIIKVEPPTMDEIKLMKGRQTLISDLQITTQSKEYIEQLLQKKITALAFEYIHDESGLMPFMRSMSEIAGNTSLLIE